MRSRLGRYGLLVATLIAGAQGAWATDYYVSPAGDDANTGTTEAEAMRTIQAGVDELQPGDTLLIRGGTYRESVTFQRGGEEGRPVTARPYEGEEVLVTGCDPVAGWERHEGDIWRAEMPWTVGLGMNQVFAGGELTQEPKHQAAVLSVLAYLFDECDIFERERDEKP